MAQATTLEKLQTLWHYRPDYAYRPNLFQYTDGYTTDPNYVVSEVSMMSPGWQHAETLDQVRQALHILTQFCEPPIHVSRRWHYRDSGADGYLGLGPPHFHFGA